MAEYFALSAVCPLKIKENYMSRKRRKWEGKEIEIGGLKYTIIYKNLKNRQKGIATKAEIDFKKRVLTLNIGMKPDEEIQSIIHELCHGILDALIPARILTKIEMEEELIMEPFSRMLVSALRSADLLKE
jgi:hypothetical protein